MASKVEQQYKLLNAELMDHVQKQRIEIGLYKKELVALKHENMELRQARILENARQREDHISIVKNLMQRLEIDPGSLADNTLINQTNHEPELPAASFIVTRRRQQRRSSKEICQEMRQSSALASISTAISPARRRSSMPEEPNKAPKLAPTAAPQEETESLNERFNALLCSATTLPAERGRDSISEEPNEASRLSHTPSPRRAAEIAVDSSTEEEQEQASPSAANNQEEPQRRSSDPLWTICEDTVSSASYSSSPISCDSTIEEYSPPRQVLRSIDLNVPPTGGMLTRSKSNKSLATDKDNSVEEQPSIQVPRLMLTTPSPTHGDSLGSRSSIALDASKLSPRRTYFGGNFLLGGTNTSTPIRHRSSPQQMKRDSWEPRVRISRLKIEPTKGEQAEDWSTSCLSSSGRRPSRKCRPTKLSEPNLRDKLRNTQGGKKSK